MYIVQLLRTYYVCNKTYVDRSHFYVVYCVCTRVYAENVGHHQMEKEEGIGRLDDSNQPNKAESTRVWRKKLKD